MNKLEPYRPCAAVKPATAKLLLLMLRDITDDRDTVIVPQRYVADTACHRKARSLIFMGVS